MISRKAKTKHANIVVPFALVVRIAIRGSRILGTRPNSPIPLLRDWWRPIPGLWDWNNVH